MPPDFQSRLKESDSFTHIPSTCKPLQRKGGRQAVLWDDKILQNLKIGGNLQVRNGFVTSYRGEWRINIGKYGEIKRI